MCPCGAGAAGSTAYCSFSHVRGQDVAAVTLELGVEDMRHATHPMRRMTGASLTVPNVAMTCPPVPAFVLARCFPSYLMYPSSADDVGTARASQSRNIHQGEDRPAVPHEHGLREAQPGPEYSFRGGRHPHQASCGPGSGHEDCFR